MNDKTTTEPQETQHTARPLLSGELGVNVWKDTYWKDTPNDPWGCERRCIYCGAGDDDSHSYSCATGMHPDKRGIVIPNMEYTPSKVPNLETRDK